MINNQGGHAGGGGPATRSHKSLSSHVAGSLQRAPGLYWAAWPGAQESPPCGAPSSDGSADPGLTNLTPSALPRAWRTHPTLPLCPGLRPLLSISSHPPKNPRRHLMRVFPMSLETGWANMRTAILLDALDYSRPTEPSDSSGTYKSHDLGNSLNLSSRAKYRQ